MSGDLSKKQQMFVAEYCKSLNATKAAIAAGYSAKTANEQGSRLLANVKVSAEIDRLTAKRLDKLGVTAEYVLQGIVETIERCRQSAPVLDRKGRQVYVETPEGDEAAAYTFQALSALKGYELLGKHLKLFTEKIEASGPNGGPFQYEDVNLKDLSSEQRAELKRLLIAARDSRPAH